ncbi:MAG: hypothetical protein R3B38_01525 [Patescibacteria group bacterium]
MPKRQLEEFEPEFASQRDGEYVIDIVWAHWYALLIRVMGSLGIILASFLIPALLGIMPYIFMYGITTAIYYLWMVFWVFQIVQSYVIWLKDKCIITNERIIKVDQKNVVDHKVTTVELERIQAVVYAMKGPAANTFKFGTVSIYFPGGNNIEIKYAANPSILQEEISRMVKKNQKGLDKQTTDDIEDFLDDEGEK